MSTATEITRDEKLRQLRRVVEAAPDDRLHMRTFSEDAPCGTAHCAAGWAAVDPWFRENTAIHECFAVTGDGYATGRMLFMDSALANVFDLSEEDVQNLFLIDSERAVYRALDRDPHAITKADVLANIDRLLAGKPAVPYDVPGGR